MSANIGTAVVEIIPDFSKFAGEVSREANKAMEDAARQVEPIEPKVEADLPEAKKVGERVGETVRESFGAAADLPDEVRDQTRGIARRVGRVASAAGRNIGEALNRGMAVAVRAGTSVIGAATNAGRRIGTAVSRGFQLTANFTRAMRRGLAASGRQLQTFGRQASLAALPIAAGFGVGISKIIETEKQLAQTNAVLLSTSGVANVTADEIATMADNLATLSGVDDDAIQAGENLILTFTKIRNEAGAGNDIFDQTVATLVDMSVAMGQEPRDAAIQLGKALNDPVKGVSALGRAGVQFTEEQKELIATLVESGNIMEAQKIILKELETQFGGSAEAAGRTLGGRLGVLKQDFEVLAASIVEQLLPTINQLLGFVDRGIAFFSALPEPVKRTTAVVAALGLVVGPLALALGLVATALGTISATAAGVAAGIAGVAVVIAGVVNAIRTSDELGERFQDGMEGIRDAFDSFAVSAQIAFEIVRDALEDLGDSVTENIDPERLDQILRFVADSVRVLGDSMIVVAQIFSTAAPIIGRVIAHIVNVTGSLVNMLTFVIAAFSDFVGNWSSGFQVIADAVTGFVSNVWDGFVANFTDNWQLIIDVTAAVWDFYKEFWSGVVDGFTDFARSVISVVQGIAEGISRRLNSIVGFFAALPNRIFGAVAGFGDRLQVRARGWMRRIRAGLSSGMASIREFFANLLGNIVSWLAALPASMFALGKRVITSFLDGMKDAWGAVSSWLSSRAKEIINLKGPLAYDKTILKPAGNAVMGGFLTGLREGFNPVQSWLSDVGPSLNGMLSLSDTNKAWQISVDAMLGNISDPAGKLDKLAPKVPRAATSAADITKQAQLLAKMFGVSITSQFRSPASNAAAGGVKNSQHLSGFAVDFGTPNPLTDGRLDRMFDFLMKFVGKALTQVIWRSPGHFDHLHAGWLRALSGRRQFGGGVTGGEPFLVGEAGPEVFIPNQRGFVMRNDDARLVADFARKQMMMDQGGRERSTRGAGPEQVTFNVNTSDPLTAAMRVRRQLKDVVGGVRVR